MFLHQFGRLVENRVILNQNQVWDVRSSTGPWFLPDTATRSSRTCLISTFALSDRYRYPFCEANRDGQTFWEVPGSHLTFDEEARRTEVEFLTMTVGSNVVPVR